ncbi:MAG: HAMP domain-containing protein [Chloroflexi bacterium]|nr:HAMP domain-containing protein [Chloroflexota bacterium]
MRAKQYLSSLRFKITVGAAILLVPILGAYSHIQYYRQYDILLGDLEHSTTAMGQVITSSLQPALLSNNVDEIQHIVAGVAQQDDIVNLALLDRQGTVRIAPKGEAVGAQLNPQDPTCQVCHRYSQDERQGSVILDQPNGRILRTMTPIQNRPECYGCHDSNVWLNGVLLADVSMANVDQYMAVDLRDSILGSFAAMFLTIAAIHFLMSRLVVSKLERLVQSIKRFGRGDLGERVSITGGDEIGELGQAFNRMADGLQAKEKENQQLYAELQRKEVLRGQLLEKLNHAQEQERKRIARDLHDQLGQVLSAMTMEIEAAERALPPEQARLKERLLHARSVAINAMDQTHALILDLRPFVLDDLGLVPALRSYADQTLAPRGVQVQVTVAGPARRLPPEAETVLFRIAQEALNNIANHAAAQHATVALQFGEARVQVMIQDDGCGFDPVLPGSIDEWRGLGLLGMQERATLAGGMVEIESKPGQGTRVLITMPFAEPAAPDGPAGKETVAAPPVQ